MFEIKVVEIKRTGKKLNQPIDKFTLIYRVFDISEFEIKRVNCVYLYKLKCIKDYIK